jgi:replication initiation protein RepC
MLHTRNLAAGSRRFDDHFRAADAVAKRFRGLAAEVTPGNVLAAIKRARKEIGASARVVGLIDTLFAWTKPQDWEPGQTPIVWPSNERLADELDVEVRQVQKLLDQAVALGLISHRDGPNGHRTGRRGPDGRITWAFGINLAPLGVRMGEFLQLAERRRLDLARREELRRRLTIARRSIAMIAQTALEWGLTGADWLAEAEATREAVRELTGVRCTEALAVAVELLEARRDALHGVFTDELAAAKRARNPVDSAKNDVNRTSSDDLEATHITTTNPSPPAEAGVRSGHQGESSRLPDVRILAPKSNVEDDLERHGVDHAFVHSVAAEIAWELEYGCSGWGDAIRAAERLVGELSIPRHAWHEACRLMGDKGAAAAVIATGAKYRGGEVRSPGAYLRGMSQKAAGGELRLGKTFHGLKDAARRIEGGDGSASCFRVGNSGAAPAPTEGAFGAVARRVTDGFRPK